MTDTTVKWNVWKKILRLFRQVILGFSSTQMKKKHTHILTIFCKRPSTCYIAMVFPAPKAKSSLFQLTSIQIKKVMISWFAKRKSATCFDMSAESVNDGLYYGYRLQWRFPNLIKRDSEGRCTHGPMIRRMILQSGCLDFCSFLSHDLDQDQWCKITQIMVHQTNRWIHSG